MKERSYPSQANHSRARIIVAAALILLPLILSIGVRYRTASQQAAATATIQSLVVAPARVTGTPDKMYLSDAVSATLTAHLEKIGDLETRHPPSSAAFERIGRNPATLASAYDVDALILTAITIDGDLYMIDLEITDSRSQRLIWTGQYQGPRTQFIPLVNAAGEGLRQVLRPDSPRVQLRSGVSSSSDAELAFREGEYHRDRENQESARAAFARALELDPGLAVAAAEIAMLYAKGDHADISQVEHWAERALKIDSSCGRAHVALAQANHRREPFDAATTLVHALKAASLEPRYPPAQRVLASALLSATLAKSAREQWLRLAPLEREEPAATETSLLDQDEELRIIRQAQALGEAPAYLVALLPKTQPD